jgi:hypothetical protein
VLARALAVGVCAVLTLVPSARAAVKLHAGPVEVRGVAFSTAAGQFHATRVVSRAGSRVTLATNDPSRRRVELRLLRGALSARPLGGGVRNIEIALRARRGERYLGFGER